MRRPRPATATSSTSAGTGGRSLLASSFSLVALSVWGVSLLSVMPPWEVEAFHLARAGAGARPSGAAAAGVAGRIRTLQMRPSSARVIGLDPTRLAAAAASASATSGDDPDPDETFRSFVEEEQDVEDLIESDGEVAEVDDPATAPDVVPGLEDLPELDELARYEGRQGPARPLTADWWEEELPEIFMAVLIDSDKPGEFEDKRVPNFIEHMMWCRRTTRRRKVNALVLSDHYLVAKTLDKSCGNIIEIAARSRAHAELLLEQEPYTNAGLIESATLYRWPKSKDEDLRQQDGSFPYVFIGLDKKDSQDLRKATRVAHTKYLKDLKRVTAGGPLLPAEGGSPVGTLLYITADNDDHAHQLAMEDPYTKAGLFETVTVMRVGELDVNGTGTMAYARNDPLQLQMDKENLLIPTDYLSQHKNMPSLLTVNDRKRQLTIKLAKERAIAAGLRNL